MTLLLQDLDQLGSTVIDAKTSKDKDSWLNQFTSPDYQLIIMTHGCMTFTPGYGERKMMCKESFHVRLNKAVMGFKHKPLNQQANAVTKRLNAILDWKRNARVDYSKQVPFQIVSCTYVGLN